MDWNDPLTSLPARALNFERVIALDAVYHVALVNAECDFVAIGKDCDVVALLAAGVSSPVEGYRVASRISRAAFAVDLSLHSRPCRGVDASRWCS